MTLRASADRGVASLDALRDGHRRLHALQAARAWAAQIVFGVGNPERGLMFVGEAPGADEDMQGEPFVGRAGQLLTKIIEAIGLRATTSTSRT